jgi:pimeloyl-ACP methyl ester carboxylesterase
LGAESIEKYVNDLKTPALIVWGEKDRVINPATAEILHKMMPNSEVIMMKGIGHLPMLEQPRRSAEDYLKFREKLGKDN